MTETLEPASVEELSEAVRSTGDRAIAATGSGTALGLGNPATREDIALHTRSLRRIVDYAPEDQVVVVEAGVTLGDLQAELGKCRQRLAIDSPAGDRATIGGMLATNAYGPSALRYGTLKDLIVGVELVRADGAIARAGGKVVKNVAGFDVSKLIVGSLGTLAIVTKATFRVHPLPESARRLGFDAKVEQVFPFVLALREAQLEPASIEVRFKPDARHGGDVKSSGAERRTQRATVLVAFEGFGPGVDAQSAACEGVARAAGLKEGGDISAGMKEGGDISAGMKEGGDISGCHPERSDAAHRGVEGQRRYTLKATYPPSEFERIARAVHGVALAFPSLGVIFFDGPSTAGAMAPYARDDRSAAPYARDDGSGVTELRELFESLGGTLVVHDMPSDWRGKIDAWGTPPPAFKLMRALKERFDPDHRLNPGRFVGGL